MFDLRYLATRAFALMLIAFAAVVFLAACGGSDDDSGTELNGSGQGEPQERNGDPGQGDGVPGGGQTPISETIIDGGEMKLTVVEGGSCTGADCFVEAGATFTLGVEVVEAPPSYVLLQTFVDFGVYDPEASEDDAGDGTCGDGIENGPVVDGQTDGADRADEDCVTVALTYVPATEAADEFFWADLEPATAVRALSMGPGLVGHGGISGLIPPLPESTATGIMTQLEMSCPADAVDVPISLLIYRDPLASTSGSAFVAPDAGTKIVPAITPITLHCEAP